MGVLFFLIVIYRSPFLRPSFSLVMVSGSEWMSQLGELLNRDWFLPKKYEIKRLGSKKAFQRSNFLIWRSPYWYLITLGGGYRKRKTNPIFSFNKKYLRVGKMKTMTHLFEREGQRRRLLNEVPNNPLQVGRSYLGPEVEWSEVLRSG